MTVELKMTPILVLVAGIGPVSIDVPASSFEAACASLEQNGYLDGVEPTSRKKARIFKTAILSIGERVEQSVAALIAPAPNRFRAR